MSWFDDAQLGDQSAVLVADEIDLNKRINDVEMDSHVWHCSLSLRADERPVSDREWADMTEKFMDDMGFTGADGKAPCQWVAVHHGTSTAGNDHIHIVASRVREDGTKWSDWSDFPKAQTAARNLEKQFGLMELGQHSERGLKPAEQLTDRRTGNSIEPARHRMERVVRASAVASESEAEFVRRLRRWRPSIFRLSNPALDLMRVFLAQACSRFITRCPLSELTLWFSDFLERLRADFLGP